MTAGVDPVRVKSHILRSLRETLAEYGFAEVITPVVRRADLGSARRAPVELGGTRYLRSMIGPALRVNLEHHPRVFEIGPCFRPEPANELHAQEFTMLDLYAADETFNYLIDLAARLVAPHLAYKPQRISVADRVQEIFGVDLRRQPIGDLPARMAFHLGMAPLTSFKEILGQFVEQELEAPTRGAAVFLTDYPAGGDEPCARLTPRTEAVLNRFELIVDGVEVVHGYEDEPDYAAFLERAHAVGLYDHEQQLAWDAILTGRVPTTSAGLGIGIERLCAVACGTRDIRPFMQSAQF